MEGFYIPIVFSLILIFRVAEHFTPIFAALLVFDKIVGFALSAFVIFSMLWSETLNLLPNKPREHLPQVLCSGCFLSLESSPRYPDIPRPCSFASFRSGPY